MNMRNDFSLVIPTKNEEINLKQLLEQIESQTLKPKEIIIADSSTDKTPEIAKKFGCRIVQGDAGGRIGKARNRGAQTTIFEIIVFCDADIQFPDSDFFKNIINYFMKNKLDFASSYVKSDSFHLELTINLLLTNFSKKIGNKLERPLVENEAFLILKRSIFLKTDGFRDDLLFAEGPEYFRRLYKLGYKYGVVPYTIITQPRKSRTFLKTLHMMFWGNLWGISQWLPKKYSDKIYEKCGELYWDTK